MIRAARLIGAIAAMTFVVATGTAVAADSAFSAHGSPEQVYATGLQPGVKAALLNSKGKTVATKKADSLGALLFRNVKPGSGYRVSAGGVKSDALTVLSDDPTPPSTD